MPRCPTNPTVPPVSHTNRPGDGFYSHVNHSWLKSHHIRSWSSQFDTTTEIQDSIDTSLLTLISKIQKDEPTSNIGKLCTLWNTRSAAKEELYIKLCLNQVLSLNPVDIARFFGWMCRSSISTMVQLVKQEETVPPYFLRLSITPGRLTLPLKYYCTPSLQKSDVWNAYVAYVNTCSVELGLPFLHHAIEAELELAKQLNIPYKNTLTNYTGRQLQRSAPDFEWQAFMEGLTIDKWKSRIWVVDSPQLVQRIFHWICTTSLENVVAILALNTITFGAPYLRSAIHDATKKLFHTALKGITRESPEKHQFLEDLKSVLPEELSIMYAKTQYTDAKHANVTSLVEGLRAAAVEIMDETTALSKKAKSAAKEKIHRMRCTIGSVSGDTEISKALDIPYYKDSFLHTVILLQHARMNQLYSLTGKPSNTIHSYPCFIVNASYYMELNHIVIPWGILQWPFYCKDAPLGWNHGGIGATIGHELTHGFDLEGSQYSPRAVFKKWWTRKDRQGFKRRTRKLGKFFSKFKHYGLHVDGMKTLSEDWADLGGMAIALRDLKTQIRSKGLNQADTKETYRQFFIAYAVSWRSLVRKKQMVFSIMTSVHAPAEDRVDRIVPQFQEWVDAFDVKETDRLYIPPAKRLRFF